jgi:hypothetical protein
MELGSQRTFLNPYDSFDLNGLLEVEVFEVEFTTEANLVVEQHNLYQGLWLRTLRY